MPATKPSSTMSARTDRAGRTFTVEPTLDRHIGASVPIGSAVVDTPGAGSGAQPAVRMSHNARAIPALAPSPRWRSRALLARLSCPPGASTLRDEMAMSGQRLLAARGQIPMAAHRTVHGIRRQHRFRMSQPLGTEGAGLARCESCSGGAAAIARCEVGEHSNRSGSVRGRRRRGYLERRRVGRRGGGRHAHWWPAGSQPD